MPYYVYILQCSNKTFYTGNTSNLAARISQHFYGYNPKSYTHKLRPVKLVWVQEFQTRTDALTVEKQIKGWSHAKKQALIEDDFEKIHQIVEIERMNREKKNSIILIIIQLSERRPQAEVEEGEIVKSPFRLHSVPLNELGDCVYQNTPTFRALRLRSGQAEVEEGEVEKTPTQLSLP